MNSNTVVNGKLKGKVLKKKILIGMAVLLIIAVATAAGMNYLKSKNTKNVAKQQTTAVERGDLSVIVSGSGPISSTSQYDVTSNVSGTLTKINFKDGDKVKEGDLLFEIDDKDTRLQIKQLENSIAQSELSQEYSMKDLKYNTITAPIDGEVVDVQVKAGDSLSKSSTVLTITDKSKLKLLVSFSNAYRNKLSIGQEVTVNAYDTTLEELHTIKGTISGISSPSYQTSDGVEVYNVGVVIGNSSALKEGMVANVEMNIEGNTIKSKGSSTLSYVKSVTVKSESGGIVDHIDVENGQNVKKGDVLTELQNDDLQLTTETNDLKLQALQIQLEIAKEKLLDYKIYSPIDGTFTLNDVEQGNSIKQGDILGSVANYDTMEFSIDIDELDIAKIQVGQTANVSIDALTETTDAPLKGTVSKIAVEGTSSDGVSTYPVTIQLEQNAALKGGMNANAEIVVNQRTNVLYVPVEAVQKKDGKSYVMVANNNEKVAGQNSSGSVMKFVTVGISTDQYTEITSGLSEGDAVITTSASSSDTTQQNGMPGMGMPMDGGGPPAGGPPSGGGNSSGKKN